MSGPLRRLTSGRLRRLMSGPLRRPPTAGLPRPCLRRRAAQRGLSAVEALAALAILGLLLNIVAPLALRQVRRARAAAIVAEFGVIRQAAQDVAAATGRWPEDGVTGSAPAALDAPLRGRVRWSNAGQGYAYNWELWADEDGTPVHPEAGLTVGLSVVTADPRLAEALDAVYDGRLVRTAADRYTFAIEELR